MVTLCLDFGNTRLKAGLFTDDRFEEEASLERADPASVSAILETYKPGKCILASVMHHDPEIESLLASGCRFHKLSNNSKLNFTIAVSKPDTIGPDRLALLAAASDMFAGMNNLVIGMGTCITYNFLRADGQFLGGSISPGMDMRFKSMKEYTAKLPLASYAPNSPLVGYDTTTNLQSGVAYGIAGEIDGFINRYSDKYGNFNAVLTGGHAPYFAGLLKNRIFADNNFLYRGLYVLSELNN